MKSTRKYPALGILFKDEMTWAILMGRKTQTRRLVKPQPIDDTANSGHVFSGDHMNSYKNDVLHRPWQERFVELAPIKVGDILYVKETWQPFDGTFSRCVFRADAREVPGVRGLWWRNENGVDLPCEPKWKSSLYMPYEAARIFLKVTGVRVELLNDIGEADAKCEGATQGIFRAYGIDSCQLEINHHARYVDGFRYIWHNINGPGSWDANPYVWVYTFERTDKPTTPPTPQ